jgi:hypothetical protein
MAELEPELSEEASQEAVTTVSVYGRPVLVSFSENDTGFEILASGDTSQDYGQAPGEHESDSDSYPDSEEDFDTGNDTEGEGISTGRTAAPAQPTRRICAICGKSLNALVKKQGSRYCSQNCKSKARYQRKKAGLHND